MFPFSFTIPVSTNPFTTEVGDYDGLGGMPGGLYPNREWDHRDSHTSRMRTRHDGLHNVIIPDITVNQEPNIGWAEHYPKSMSESFSHHDRLRCYLAWLFTRTYDCSL